MDYMYFKFLPVFEKNIWWNPLLCSPSADSLLLLIYYPILSIIHMAFPGDANVPHFPPSPHHSDWQESSACPGIHNQHYLRASIGNFLSDVLSGEFTPLCSSQFAIFLFLCFFYYLLPGNVSSMRIRNTPIYQSFLTPRTNSNKLEARAQNKWPLT